MSRLNKKSTLSIQRGFSLLEVVIVVVVVAIIVLLGVTFMNRLNENQEFNDTTTSQVEEIKDEKGLEQAETTLDDVNLDELDVSELDAAEADLL